MAVCHRLSSSKNSRGVNNTFAKRVLEKKLKLPWIEVKKHEAQGRAQLVPLVISTAGRHEGQLPRKASEPRSRHPFDAGLPIASSAMLINHEQMDRPAEIVFKPRAAHGLKAFGRHTAIRDGSASYRACRKNLYGG